MPSLKDKINSLSSDFFLHNNIRISPIRNDYDIWYAVVECKLAPGQEELVNPAGFSIGRAYLHPEGNIPCIIWNGDTRIGYIVLRQWNGGEANSWSYYLSQEHQGYGYGRTAAKLAIQILLAADPDTPIKLSTETANHKAQQLYLDLGFQRTDELDGEDLVFIYRKEFSNDIP